MSDSGLQGAQILADLGIQIGRMPSGKFNALTDVDGVRVGHVTLVRGEPDNPPVVRTGVTAILPPGGNLFREKVEAAVHVINGFGKSVGLPQVMELGNIESPILLTGTIGTDAPLSSRQLQRVARRAAFGLARTGAVAAHGSGDFVIAFSTTTRSRERTRCRSAAAQEPVAEERLTEFFTATIEATEEAIIRSILTAETVVGRDGHRREAIPLREVVRIMSK